MQGKGGVVPSLMASLARVSLYGLPLVGSLDGSGSDLDGSPAQVGKMGVSCLTHPLRIGGGC